MDSATYLDHTLLRTTSTLAQHLCSHAITATIKRVRLTLGTSLTLQKSRHLEDSSLTIYYTFKKMNVEPVSLKNLLVQNTVVLATCVLKSLIITAFG